MGDMQPLQVSVRAATRLLGVCRSTIYRMEAEKRITLNRRCGRTMVPMSEIHRLCPMPSAVREPVAEPKKLHLKKRKLIPRGRRN